eukprot:m.38142 g.38142  ORF g.38142 m.38142 type:complete len:98 (+) comp10185_c2_seq1:641-934(+)
MKMMEENKNTHLKYSTMPTKNICNKKSHIALVECIQSTSKQITHINKTKKMHTSRHTNAMYTQKAQGQAQIQKLKYKSSNTTRTTTKTTHMLRIQSF